MIRVLLVDDEKPARDHLRELLAAHADVVIVGEAEHGEEAIKQIEDLKPQVAFLDIQMPGCTGLEVASNLSPGRVRIVFCTAFDAYAMQAFDVHAVDYLLKPVNRVRLDRTLDRVRASMSSGVDLDAEQGVLAASRTPPRFLAKHANRYRVVPQSEADYFSILNGMTALHAAGQQYWMDMNLSELERRLNPNEFARVSREQIVRLSSIVEVHPLVGGHAELVLRTGEHIAVSRRRLKELMDKLVAFR